MIEIFLPMLKKFLYNHDWIITATTILILFTGLMTIYSTTIYDANGGVFPRQVIFSITGILLYFLISSIDYSYLRYKPIIILLYGFDLMLLVFGFLAGHTAGGATRWLSFGTLDLQPSEVTKVVLILTLSSFFTSTAVSQGRALLQSLALFAPLAILVFIEPSLSSTIVLAVIWFAIVFFATQNQGKNFLFFLLFLLFFNIGGNFFMPKLLFFPIIKDISTGILLLSMIAGGAFFLVKLANVKTLSLVLLTGLLLGFGTRYVVWNKVLKPYQKQRITAYLSVQSQSNIDPTTNPSVFQVTQSKIAIGSGELFGKGFAQGTQSKLNFLPDHNTDFIFASFSEEFGLVGDSLLMILFTVLLFRIIAVNERVPDKFGFLIVVGILAMFIFQVFVNIAINVGLLPSTGVPMPLMSYGGSSLWITFIMLGLVQSIYRKSKEKKWLSIDIS